MNTGRKFTASEFAEQDKYITKLHTVIAIGDKRIAALIADNNELRAMTEGLSATIAEEAVTIGKLRDQITDKDDWIVALETATREYANTTTELRATIEGLTAMIADKEMLNTDMVVRTGVLRGTIIELRATIAKKNELIDELRETLEAVAPVF